MTFGGPAPRPSVFRSSTSLRLIAALVSTACTVASLGVLGRQSSALSSGDQAPPLHALGNLVLPETSFLVAVAVAGVLLGRSHIDVSRLAHPRSRWVEGLALAVIIAVATAARFWRLGTTPYGLWFDTAQDGNVALRMVSDPTYRPIFVPDLTQLPALYLYLLAGAIRAIGPTPSAVRTVGALVGVVGVVTTWGAARALFGGTVAIIAGAAAAASSWLLAIDRISIASVVVPATAAGAVWCVASACRWDDSQGECKHASTRGWLVRCGAAAAVTAIGLYAYWGAYFAPPVVALLIVFTSWRRGHVPVTGAGEQTLSPHERSRQPISNQGISTFSRSAEPPGIRAENLRKSAPRNRWRNVSWEAGIGLAVFCVSLAVAMLPLLTYATAHPDAFGRRLSDASVLGGPPISRAFALTGSAIRHGVMFWVWGDRNPRHNLVGTPELDPWSGTLLALGMVCSIVSKSDRGRGFWLLAWIGIGLGAGILATASEAPNAHRVIVVVPAVCLFVGLGLDRLVRVVTTLCGALVGSKSTANAAGSAFLVMGLLCVAVAGLRGFAAQQSDLRTQQAHSPLPTLFARDVNALPAGIRLYSGVGVDRTDPTVRFLSGRAAGASDMGGAASFAVPTVPMSIYLLAGDTGDLAVLRRLYPSATETDLQPPYGGPTLLRRLDAGTGLTPTTSLGQPTSFGGKLAITVVAVQPESDRAGAWVVALRLHALVDSPGYLSATMRAVDAAGNEWGRQDGLGDADLSTWKAGQEGLAIVRLRFYRGTPPGPLHVQVGVYDLVSGARLAREGGGDSLDLGTIDVRAAVEAADSPSFPGLKPATASGFGPVRVSSVHLSDSSPLQGSQLTLQVEWSCPASAPVGSVLRFSLVGSDKVTIAPFSSVGNQLNPVLDQCASGSAYLVQQSVAIGPRWSPGPYTVEAQILDPSGVFVARGALADIAVRALARTTTSPPAAIPVGAQFADGIALDGVTIDQGTNGALVVHLVWRAVTPPSRDYTVFVHLLDQTGKIVAQHDGPPDAGRWPTTWWQQGQVVVDVHALQPSSATFNVARSLEIGMYDPRTNKRSALSAPGHGTVGDSSVVVPLRTTTVALVDVFPGYSFVEAVSG